jgi:hypothetical protein
MLATNPPIQHRGRREPGKLDAFEFAIAGTIAGLARVKVSAQRHEHSFATGRKAINDCEVLKRRYPDFDLGYIKPDAGIDGYWNARKEFKAPSAVTITVSARQLFRAAGLSRAENNLARLPATLQRLKEQRVGKLPPLLRGFTKAPNGRWTLEVDSRWTPLKNYKEVPWPPPTQGATTLALYLFLHGIDRREGKNKYIRVEVFCERVGIRTGQGKQPRRDLDQALAGVNRHLRELNKEGALDMLNKEDRTSRQQPLATAFELVPSHDFTKVHFQEREMEMADDGEERTDDKRAEDIRWERSRLEERMEEQNRRAQEARAERDYFGAMAQRLRGG